VPAAYLGMDGHEGQDEVQRGVPQTLQGHSRGAPGVCPVLRTEAHLKTIVLVNNLYGTLHCNVLYSIVLYQ